MRAGWRSWGVVVSVLVFGGIGSGGQAIGCAGFGQIAGTEDDLGEGSCERSRDALSFFCRGNMSLCGTMLERRCYRVAGCGQVPRTRRGCVVWRAIHAMHARFRPMLSREGRAGISRRWRSPCFPETASNGTTGW